MGLSIFLGKVIGFYCVIIGVALIFRQEKLRSMVKEYYQNTALVMFGAVISLIIGLLITCGHNIWEYSYRTIITMIGYLAVLKGILNLFHPERMKKLSHQILEGTNIHLLAAIEILIGLFLLYQCLNPSL